MRSLGTSTIVEVTVPVDCASCGGDATFGIATTNNPIKYFCTGDLKTFLDTLKD